MLLLSFIPNMQYAIESVLGIVDWQRDWTHGVVRIGSCSAKAPLGRYKGIPFSSKFSLSHNSSQFITGKKASSQWRKGAIGLLVGYFPLSYNGCERSAVQTIDITSHLSGHPSGDVMTHDKGSMAAICQATGSSLILGRSSCAGSFPAVPCLWRINKTDAGAVASHPSVAMSYQRCVVNHFSPLSFFLSFTRHSLRSSLCSTVIH
jgi:hypothetical protein